MSPVKQARTWKGVLFSSAVPYEWVTVIQLEFQLPLLSLSPFPSCIIQLPRLKNWTVAIKFNNYNIK
jgi:hypothetical protein